MKTDQNILIAFLLNIMFSIIEFVGGILTGSIAITSDSIHDLGDALSIGISYFLERKSKKKIDKNHTYGYIRYSVVGSIITTIILIIGSIFVIYEAVKRIINPIEINYKGMIIFAIFGVIVNFIATYVTRDGDSLNQKSVNLHMLEDVLGWIVVLIGSILIKFTNISLIDPILSIGVAIFILYNALKNFKTIMDIFLEITPNDIDIEELKKHILKVDGVIDVHHIHIRSIDGYNNFATMHIVVDKYNDYVKHKVRDELIEHNICHSTIEIETEKEKCSNRECLIDNVDIKHHHHHHH
ncbi:MAG: cation transporter [Bacilli bacterium]|nr:cation transporter [Bacilli bacterium]